MASSLMADIQQLSVAERIQLVEDIWDSIPASLDELPVTDAQMAELGRRLEAYRQSPQEGATWQEVKARITSRR